MLKQPSRVQVNLQNIVATVSLKLPYNDELDLRQIALKARNAEYNPKRFAAVIMRQREENTKTTALVFRSGKIVITGAKSEEMALAAGKKYGKMIRKIVNSKVEIGEFKIHNVVATADFGMEIGLERLNLEHNKFSSYEPELFPGLVYRMISPKCVMLIFASGKVVFTGAKTRADVLSARDCIEPVLRKHQKKKVLPINNSFIDRLRSSFKV